jgi:transposase
MKSMASGSSAWCCSGPAHVATRVRSDYDVAVFLKDLDGFGKEARRTKPVCSGCHKPAAGYDQLSIRRFEFVPFWGFMVLLLYRMRRVDCRACGVRVEELPWAANIS